MYWRGIVEGFYGRQWPHTTRLAYPALLQRLGFNSYLYAPKGDNYLRKHWRQPWPQAEWQQLQQLAAACRQQGLKFGIGLSPLGLVNSFNAQSQQQLRNKLAQLLDLNPSLFALLFDDTVTEQQNLAARQAEICAFVEAELPAQALFVCPSYYSFDPVLELHFGPRPSNYWQDLGQALSSCWQLFWTGDKVVSRRYEKTSLQTITALFNRPPLIWDNHPANDGRHLCRFLPLQRVVREGLDPLTAGVLHNPMNQPWCSAISLARMVLPDEKVAAATGLPEDLVALVLQHEADFSRKGLQQLTPEEQAELASKFGAFNHNLAREITDWLAGEYAFDPACLT